MNAKKVTPNRGGLASSLASAVGINLGPRDQPAVKPEIPPSRQGKIGINTYHDPAVAQQLKLLSAEKGISQQKLMAEALNMLFAKYGKGQIA
jgi:hypothetical protein